MDIFGAIVRFFHSGGIFMFPIAVVLALGVAVTIERWFYLQRTAGKNRSDWREMAPLLHSGDLRTLSDVAGRSDSAVANLLSFGLARVRQGWQPEQVERAMESSMMDTLPIVEKRTHYLATLANVATLLGLLGTIMGLIHAFSAVGDASAAEKAALLSFSISEALNCTAFGLLVAIPLMLIHSMLQSRGSEITDTMETAAAKLLDAVAAAGVPPARHVVPPTRPMTAPAAPAAAPKPGAIRA